MKIFKVFSSGKEILLNDSKKLIQYLNLCKNTPITYKGVKQSLGYQNIMKAQLNSLTFNNQIFQQITELIMRDLKELNEKEFNTYLQAIANYLKINENQEVQFENIIQNLLKNATYIQKVSFFIYIIGVFDKKYLEKYSQNFQYFQNSLKLYQPHNDEEQVWKYVLQFSLIDIETNHQIIEKENLLNQYLMDLQVFQVAIPKFQYQFTKIMLMHLNSLISQEKLKLNEKQIQNQLWINKLCQTDLDISFDTLNFYQLFIYVRILIQYKDLFMGISWDLINQELLSRNLDEIPLDNIIVFLTNIINNNQSLQVIEHFVNHLYRNINMIKPSDYVQIFQILANCNVECGNSFLKKLEKKINPKIITLNDLSLMLAILADLELLDKIMYEKWLLGVGNRIKQIDIKNAFGILFAINQQKQQNPLILKQILSKQLTDEDILLQIQLLQYFQYHDNKNPKIKEIQQNVFKVLKSNNNQIILQMFLQVLVNINIQSKKTIEIIPEMKTVIQEYFNQKQYQEKDEDMGFDVKDMIYSLYNL